MPYVRQRLGHDAQRKETSLAAAAQDTDADSENAMYKDDEERVGSSLESSANSSSQEFSPEDADMASVQTLQNIETDSVIELATMATHR